MVELMYILKLLMPIVLSTSHVHPLFCDVSISTLAIVHLILAIMIRTALI